MTRLPGSRPTTGSAAPGSTAIDAEPFQSPTQRAGPGMISNRRPNMIVLPGDGIGPEVIRQAVRVLEWFTARRGFDCEVRHEEFGADAYYRTGSFLKEEVLADMLTADAILF